jgi:outer membrane lipoprotein-sorting protein
VRILGTDLDRDVPMSRLAFPLHSRRPGLGPTVLAALLACAVLAPLPLNAQQTPREIIDEVDRLLRGESSRGRFTMEIVTEHWSRSLEIRVWSLGTEYALARVLAPAKEAGTATLKVDQEVWNYLPRVDRTIKVPPSLMMGSWMGSHFTNDDLVKDSRLIEDYDITIDFEGARDGVDVWEFALEPKPEAPVVWGRIVMQVRKRDKMPTWARYYDERGRLERTVTLGDYRVMGGRLVPARMDVVPADEPGERTTMIYEELEFDVGLSPGFFSLRNLRARESR